MHEWLKCALGNAQAQAANLLLANSTDYLIRSQRVRNGGARNMMTTVFSLSFQQIRPSICFR